MKKVLVGILISMFCTLTFSTNAFAANSKGAILQMTATLENSTTELQFNYGEYIDDGRGITFGCIGFCTGTYDGNELIKYYTNLNTDNTLKKYIPALDIIDAGPHNTAGGDGNDSTVGLDNFIKDVNNCTDPLFKKAQLDKVDELYYNPAVSMYNAIGAEYQLTLAFIYDMNVRHGINGTKSIIDKATSAIGGTPKTGVNEKTYLSKLISLRDIELKNEGLGDVNRTDGYKSLLSSGNVNLRRPFVFTAYGDKFTITGDLGIDIVSVNGVTLNNRALSLKVGASHTLIAKVAPSNATNKAVTYTSNNNQVATVDSAGKVTGKSVGTAIITVKTADSGKTATCKVTVKGYTTPVNLALNKNVTQSSSETSNYKGSKAVDGKVNTRWASAEFTNTPEWIVIDLGKPEALSQIEINWEAAYAKEYSIQGSNDGVNFKDVLKVTDGIGGRDIRKIDNVNSRYVRIYCTKKGISYGYSIYEIKVLR